MQRIYREVMIMGLSSFVLGIVETANISLGREWDLAYYFADQCAFVTAVFFACHGLGLMAISVRDSKGWERAGKIDSHQLLLDAQQFQKNHSIIWSHRFFPFCSTRNQVEFRVFQALFSSTYHIGSDCITFDFAQYLRKYHENNLIKLINLDAWKWFLVLAMTSVSALFEHLFRPFCNYDDCQFRWSLIVFTSGGGLLVACGLCLLVVGRRSEFRLLAKVGVLDSSDYEIFLMNERKVKAMISFVELDRNIIITTITELKQESAIKTFHKQEGLMNFHVSGNNVSSSSGAVVGKQENCGGDGDSEGTSDKIIVTKKSSSKVPNKRKLLPHISSNKTFAGVSKDDGTDGEELGQQEEKQAANIAKSNEVALLDGSRSFDSDSSATDEEESIHKGRKNYQKVTPKGCSVPMSLRKSSSDSSSEGTKQKTSEGEAQSTPPKKALGPRMLSSRVFSFKSMMGRSASNLGQDFSSTSQPDSQGLSSPADHSPTPSLKAVFTRGISRKMVFSAKQSNDAIASVEKGATDLSPRGKLPMHPNLKARAASSRSIFDILPDEKSAPARSFSRGFSRSFSYANEMSPAKLRQRSLGNHFSPLASSLESIPMSMGGQSMTLHSDTVKRVLTKEEKNAKRKLKDKLRMGYNDGAGHTIYFKDIFTWKLPYLYYGAIDLVMTANSLYISWWITTFIFVARRLNDPLEGLLWIFISLLPALLIFPILGVVVRTATILKSLTELDLDAVATVVEKTMEIRKHVNLLRGNLRQRMDRLPPAQKEVALSELFAAVDDTENGELTREDFRRMLVRLQVCYYLHSSHLLSLS